MFWLIEIETYDFNIGAHKKADLTGKVLIVSSQLWSLIRGDKVVSMLIGPGIFKGRAESNGINIDVMEYIGGLMFDPSKLRLDEPLPEVDIVNPEVIDPLESGRIEEIITIIRKIIVEHGNVLTGDLIMKHRPKASIPMTAHAMELAKKIRVSHVSGVQRAKFVLAGANGPMYKPMVKHYHSRGYLNPEKIKILAVPFGQFARIKDSEIMDDWLIVEKTGVDTTTGAKAIQTEFEEVMKSIKRNEDKYIYEI